jgi:hypothetical protein
MRDESGKVREDAITIKDYGTAKKRIENLKGQPSYFEVDAEKLDENTRQNIYGHKSVDTDLTELPTVKYVRIKIGMNEQQDKHYGEPSSSNI